MRVSIGLVAILLMSVPLELLADYLQVSPVYRFHSSRNGHVFTIDEEYKRFLEIFGTDTRYEGVAFYAYRDGDQPSNAKPVYTFKNSATGTYFYTISEIERETLDLHPEWGYESEGIAFFAYSPETQLPDQALPVYRLFDPSSGNYFFTAAMSERDSLVTDPPGFRYEGTGWYALSTIVPQPAIAWHGVSGSSETQIDMVTEGGSIIELTLGLDMRFHGDGAPLSVYPPVPIDLVKGRSFVVEGSAVAPSGREVPYSLTGSYNPNDQSWAIIYAYDPVPRFQDSWRIMGRIDAKLLRGN